MYHFVGSLRWWTEARPVVHVLISLGQMFQLCVRNLSGKREMERAWSGEFNSDSICENKNKKIFDKEFSKLNFHTEN